MHINMNNFLNLLDTLGLSSYLGTIILYITQSICGINWNKTITFIMSILGLVYIILKITETIINIRKKNKK